MIFILLIAAIAGILFVAYKINDNMKKRIREGGDAEEQERIIGSSSGEPGKKS